MSIEVLYFAELKEITQKQKELFKLSDSSMQDLIKLLFRKYESLRNILWDNASASLKNHISIAINDVIIPNKDKLSISLSNGDKIAFLLPISGG